MRYSVSSSSRKVIMECSKGIGGKVPRSYKEVLMEGN